MRKVFIIVLCFFGFGLGSFAQVKTETIEMDLYFRYFDLFRYFEVPPKKLKKLEHFMTSADLKKAGDDSTYVILFRRAMRDDLIRTPFIYVRTDTTDFNLFLTKQDYDKFTVYNFDSLQQQHKKIRIKADVKEVQYFGQKAYQCINLISINKAKGETYDNKSNPYPNHYYDPINDTIK